MPHQTLISWRAPEYEFRVKSNDWYWAFWIIVISLAVISVLFSDILLAVLIILSAVTLTILAKRPPRIIEYKITNAGIQSHKSFYSYESLESFHVEDIPGHMPKLLIKSTKILSPLFSLPLRDENGETLNPEHIHETLKHHLHEELLTEPLSQKLMELIGF